MSRYVPREILIHDAIHDDPVTQRVLSPCPDVSIRFVDSPRATDVIKVFRRRFYRLVVGFVTCSLFSTLGSQTCRLEPIAG